MPSWTAEEADQTAGIYMLVGSQRGILRGRGWVLLLLETRKSDTIFSSSAFYFTRYSSRPREIGYCLILDFGKKYTYKSWETAVSAPR